MGSLIQIVLYILTATIPLVFSSISYELFEFPKFLILLSGTIIITCAWITHIILTKDTRLFVKSNYKNFAFLQWSVLAILATQLLATIFSIHPYTSFWGYYSRFHQGLLTTICYTIIFFAAAKWLDKKSAHKLINISIKTSIIISIIAILEHYNISLTCLVMTTLAHIADSATPIISSAACWGANTNPFDRSFATLGQPNWLAAYLLLNIPLLIYVYHRTQKNLLLYCGMAIYVAALIFTKSRSGFLAFGLAYFIYWLISLRTMPKAYFKKSLIHSTIPIIALIILLGTPFTPSLATVIQHSPKNDSPIAETSSSGTVLESGGTESGDIRKIVWSGALSLISHHLLLGTGPETFAYTYYWERPVAHNYTSEWDFLYNKAHNEYLNMAATTGLIGLLAYLTWHLAIGALALVEIPDSKKTNKDSELSLRQYLPVMSFAIIAFAVTNFFGFSVIPVYFLLVLLSALPLALDHQPVDSPILPASAYGYTASIVIVLLYFFPIRLFLADYYYTTGKNDNSLAFLRKAVAISPHEDLYHSALAESYSTVLNIGDNKQLALAETMITKAHNPYHLNYYKSRVKVYLALAAQDQNYYTQAAEELSRARELAPTDPKLAYNLGLVYSRQGEIKKAEVELNQAIELKKNYQDAYYALTLLYEQTKQEDKISPLLRTAQSNLATYSGLLKEKMDKYLP